MEESHPFPIKRLEEAFIRTINSPAVSVLVLLTITDVKPCNRPLEGEDSDTQRSGINESEYSAKEGGNYTALLIPPMKCLRYFQNVFEG